MCSFLTSLFLLSFLFLFVSSSIASGIKKERIDCEKELSKLELEDLWGTYVPHAYTAIRARAPHSPLFGLAWFGRILFKDSIRLTCGDSEFLKPYGWAMNDGRSFGEHIAADIQNGVIIKTQWIKNGRDGWMLRVSGDKPTTGLSSDAPSTISLVFYAISDEEESAFKTSRENPPYGHLAIKRSSRLKTDGHSGDVVLEGNFPFISTLDPSYNGDYKITIKEPNYGSIAHTKTSKKKKSKSKRPSDMEDAEDDAESSGWIEKLDHDMAKRDLSKFQVESVQLEHGQAHPKLRDTLKSKFYSTLETVLHGADLASESKQTQESAFEILKEYIPGLSNKLKKDANLNLIQKVVKVPFQMDVIFEHIKADIKTPLSQSYSPESLTEMLTKQKVVFDERFENSFPALKEKQYNESLLSFAKSAVSDILGSIGYFYGSSLLKGSQADGQPGLVPTDPKGLFTSTPSRSTFPRGFLWDEGFHQLLILRWDKKLARECLSSWLMQTFDTGWIPREQILGNYARSIFADHIKHLIIQQPDFANPPTIIMPFRALAEMDSINSNGEEDHDVFYQCNYHNIEMIFDFLRQTQKGNMPNTFRWRGRSLSHVSSANHPYTLTSGLDDYPRSAIPDDNERHIDLHAWVTWVAGSLQKIAEVTGRNSVKFKTMYEDLVDSMKKNYVKGPASSASEEECDEKGECEFDYTDGLMLESSLCDFDGHQGKSTCHIGYVTLLPLMLGLLDPQSPEVGNLLEVISSERQLFSMAGVRSLSKEDPFYSKNDKYWTGPVWIPMNYLLLASLKEKYGVEEGPYKEKAQELYEKLRSTVVMNMYRSHKESGFLWEQYSDVDGKGQRGKPFTGWSSLVTLIMAEQYDGVL